MKYITDVETFNRNLRGLTNDRLMQVIVNTAVKVSQDSEIDDEGDLTVDAEIRELLIMEAKRRMS